MSFLEEMVQYCGRWQAEEKDGDKMCDAVFVRVTCCETFQYSALFIGRGLEIAARFFYPHAVRQSGKLNLIHPLLHVLFIGDMAESGEKNFLAAANNNPFRAQSSSMEYICE